jgi:hypothetical protein
MSELGGGAGGAKKTIGRKMAGTWLLKSLAAMPLGCVVTQMNLSTLS